MKLYFHKYSRGTRPRWLIEEAGIACEIVSVDMANMAHKTPEHLRLHPHGQVPVLVDGDTAIFESAAITLYLADRAPESGLSPAIGTVERGLYYQWVLYAAVTLEAPVARVAEENRKPECDRDATIIAKATGKFSECLTVLSAALDGRDWLVANRFSAADILIAGVLIWANGMKLCAGFPAIEAYIARSMARPAFKAMRA